MTTPLPKGVYLKHGAYYVVKRNKWRRLGVTLEDVEKNYGDAVIQICGCKDTLADITKYVARLHAKTRNNATGKARRVKEFALTQKDILEMLISQDYRCAVTGLVLSLEHDAAGGMPYSPSIDRIDSGIGYTRENVRIVCLSVNYAMNKWGTHVFDKIASEYSRKK
jgi:hypothetical protein